MKKEGWEKGELNPRSLDSEPRIIPIMGIMSMLWIFRILGALRILTVIFLLALQDRGLDRIALPPKKG